MRASARAASPAALACLVALAGCKPAPAITVPSAPAAVTATAGQSSAFVTWTVPANAGGRPITGYTVTAKPGGLQISTNGANTLLFQGLTNGTSYTFTVHATNVEGNGPESPPSNAVVPMGVPGAPTDVMANADASGITVTWTAPDDGGSPITGYTVTSSPAGLTTTVTTTTATFSDAIVGTDYTFTVVATNAVGDGPASDPSNDVTIAPAMTVPGAPTGVTARVQNGDVLVSWTAPADDGNSAITGYTVVSSPAGASVSAADTSVQVSGLVAGTAYTFTVTATNAVGTGPASDPSNSVTAPFVTTIPGAPTAVTATLSGGVVTVSWTAPSSTGNSAITSYTVFSSPSGITAVTSGTSTTVSGLTPGTSYTFTITAKNAVGTGPSSAASNSVTLSAGTAVPGPPTGVTALAGDQSATVSWSAPTADGGAPVIGYVVTSSTSASTVSATGTSAILTGLPNGVPSMLSVVALNAVGSSTAALSGSVTPGPSSNAPTLVLASATDSSAAVTWVAPTGLSGITGYTVTAHPGGMQATSTTPSVSFPGLTDTVSYTFTVHATSSSGDGPESAPSNFVTPEPRLPSAETSSFTASSNSVRLQTGTPIFITLTLKLQDAEGNPVMGQYAAVTSSDVNDRVDLNPSAGVTSTAGTFAARFYAARPGLREFTGTAGPLVFTTMINVLPPSCPTASLGTGPSHSAGSTSVLIADFNGDGSLDVAYDLAGGVEVLPGNGDGTFGVVADTMVAGSASPALATADFDGDGILDMALASNGIAQVLLGNGDGTFGDEHDANLAAGTLVISTADLNRDGRMDLIASSSGGDVYVLLGNGDGTFQPAVGYPAAAAPADLQVVDLNGDGFPDVAVADSGSSDGLAVLLGNGDGTLQPVQTYPTALTHPRALGVGDFNGDGALDLVLAGSGGAKVDLQVNDQSGGFTEGGTANVSSAGGASICSADFNGDGNADVALSDGSGLDLLPGNGNGSFQSVQNFSGPLDGHVAIADFDGDGQPDVVDMASGSVAVRLGTCP
jgi:hypothetical protein